MNINGMRIEDHLGLVGSVVGRYAFRASPRFDTDDMFSVGLVALWRALGSYDASRGRAVSSYVVPAIRRAILKAMQRAARGVPEVSFDGPHTITGKPLGELISSDEPGPEEQALSAERGEPLRAALAALPERLQTIALRSVVDESTLEDIARSLPRPVSRERVRQLRAMALGQLRDALGGAARVNFRGRANPVLQPVQSPVSVLSNGSGGAAFSSHSGSGRSRT